MVNEIICVVGGMAAAYSGFMTYLFKQERKISKQCANAAYKERKQLKADYDQLKQEFQQLADEHAERKEANAKLAAGNNSIAKDYHELKEKYDKLKETYAPLAALNPFERQAVEAVTSQSTLDEWMNGPKEVK